MDTNKLILRLPTVLQEQVLTAALRTGQVWHIPQLAVLKRWFRLSGTDEGALEWVVTHAHSWQRWVQFWFEEAERARVDAQRNLDVSHSVTARERFHQSALAFALALWQTNSLEERKLLYPLLLDSFAAYGALTTPPIEKLDIAFDPAPLPAYLRLPRVPASGERLPVVVLVQGLDTIKEMDDFAEQSLLERGLATLTLDEPGIGEARIRGIRLNTITILDAAAHAVCEAIKKRPELDANRIGICGWSFGGFVAPYFAAVEPRYSVLGTLGVMWEFPFPEGMARNPLYGPVLRLMTGIDDEQDLVTLLKQITLVPVAHRIRAPSAFLHGGDDQLLAEGARHLHAAISAEKILRMVPGADHGLTWHRDTELPLLWDWFADHLGPETSSMISAERPHQNSHEVIVTREIGHRRRDTRLLSEQSKIPSSRARMRNRLWKKFVGLMGRVVILLFHLHLGWLTDHAVVVVTHRGRRSGKVRRTALYPIHYDPRSWQTCVVSVWGESDWYQNLCAASALEIAIGQQGYTPEQRLLTTEEIAALERQFRHQHPVVAWGQCWLMGWPWQASDEELLRLASTMRGVSFSPKKQE